MLIEVLLSVITSFVIFYVAQSTWYNHKRQQYMEWQQLYQVQSDQQFRGSLAPLGGLANLLFANVKEQLLEEGKNSDFPKIQM